MLRRMGTSSAADSNGLNASFSPAVRLRLDRFFRAKAVAKAIDKMTAMRKLNLRLAAFGLLPVAWTFAQAQQAQDSLSAAQQMLSAGDWSGAREKFETVLSADPANAAAQAGEVEATERLALAARAAGKADEALAALIEGRKLVPHNTRLLFDLGMQEEEMRLFYDADQALTEAEKLAPADPNVLYAVARIKMDRGDLPAAQSHLEAYLKVHPDDASAHFGLGRIYQTALQFDQARSEFLRSVELQPVQTESYYALGDLALKQGDYDEAVVRFNKTLERDPNHGGALEGSGEALFKQKKYEEARETLERAVAAAPNYAPSHYYLGLTLARLGRKEESARELDRANQITEAEKKNANNRIQQTEN
jgi:tetratricopeptide (TPR) repeat protein